MSTQPTLQEKMVNAISNSDKHEEGIVCSVCAGTACSEIAQQAISEALSEKEKKIHSLLNFLNDQFELSGELVYTKVVVEKMKDLGLISKQD